MEEWLYGKPDKLRINIHYDFKFKGQQTNLRLKWISICFNIDYDNGTMELYLNGEQVDPTPRKPMQLPSDWETSPMIVRLGKNPYDDTPFIGKIMDFQMWDRYHYSKSNSS